MSPDGRNPLSRSASNSYPTMPGAIVADVPAASDASGVFRQKRSRPSSEDTVSGSAPQQLPMKIVPVRAFSGRPPSPGGLNRASRQVPVQTLGDGSIHAFASVFL